MTSRPCRDRITKQMEYAGVVELADTLDLGSNGFPCRFKSCRPYQKKHATACFFSYIRLTASYIGYASDICFASDMPAGVRGEYNITETAGFNITFCIAKYITPLKTEYH